MYRCPCGEEGVCLAAESRRSGSVAVLWKANMVFEPRRLRTNVLYRPIIFFSLRLAGMFFATPGQNFSYFFNVGLVTIIIFKIDDAELAYSMYERRGERSGISMKS